MNNLKNIAGQFQLPGKVISIEPFGKGNINDTFLIHLTGKKTKKCIMQRLNQQVFPEPELIMENFRRLTNHLRAQLKKTNYFSLSSPQLPELYPAVNGLDFVVSGSSCWRVISFIEQAVAHEKIQNLDHAYQLGLGLGRFHNLLSTLHPEKMHHTLPGFHITPKYLKIYDAQTKKDRKTSAEIQFCQNFIDQRRSLAEVLEKAKNRQLPLRIIHGDPKINNIMVDKKNGQVVCLIDLDTVQPGLIHYDIGDCLRSCCSSHGEDMTNPQKIFFNLELCRIILQGYFTEAKKFISPPEYNYIFKAINLIPFELGLRFFSDFLAGNIYFKTRDTKQNLRRALGQFYLTRSIEKQEKQIKKIIADLRS